MARVRSRLAAERGFTIVEVLVSAVVVVLIAIAAGGAIQSAGRTATETRHRTQAYAIAQQDQAALRTLRVSDLSNYRATRTLKVDNTNYTITSTGDFISDSTGTQSCSGTVTADYISIGSTVTWPSIGTRPPVTIKSIVSPPNGTIGDDKGALSVKTTNSRSTPLANVTITGTGPDSFTATTDTTGCALFGNLPAGNYTVTPSSSTTLVDKDGNPPAAQTTSVVGGSTNSITLQYDRPGRVNLTFRTRPAPNAALVASKADTVIAFNAGMTVPKKYGTVGTFLSTVPATNLFPFTSPDSFYAGNCTSDAPPNGSPALKSVTVPVAGTTSGVIQLPALYLSVNSGTGSANPGTPVANARVILTDKGAGCGTKRTFTTNAAGALPDPGLPYAVYDVCVDNGTKKVTVADVSVRDLTLGTSLAVYLGSTGAVNGVCS